jgi:hypothetical protein
MNPLMNVSLGKMEARIETGREPREAKIKVGLEEVKAMDLKANPEEIEAISEHQEVPNEEATADTIRALDDRHGDQHLAEGCHQQPKTWIQSSGGSCQKLVTARK